MHRHQKALRVSLMITIAIVFALGSFNRQADAHAYSASYTTLDISKSRIEMTYSLDELSVIELVGGDMDQNGMLDEQEFDAVKERLLKVLEQDIAFKIDNQPQAWSDVESLVMDRQGDATKAILKLRFPSATSSQPMSLTDRLYVNNKATANYVDLVTIHYGSQKSTAALSGSNRMWAMQLTDNEYANLSQDGQTAQQDTANAPDGEKPAVENAGDTSQAYTGWLSFFTLGMNHILSGYDHLLFLFSLLIARQTFKQYAAMITAFTVAHSITLTLTVLGFINVPAIIVEPAIALSICFVAIDNMIRERVSYRWVLTFIFGLIHGMGFADILKEMDIPRSELAVDLVSFNLGIETVQLIMIAILLPLLALLHRWKYSRRTVLGCSAVAFALGGIWLVQRLFFS
ncbi:HupE/UreJ family protein [Paenibacillus dokdonensis]|uniref:HupE/UreJ family protein n=1 Tax=Paenibacillus dokdonensis TaxID=2567944 RepID=UPI0010A8D7C7|nr:HupE/UreJ family protein [Paenibacillus dokdonensis]